MPAAPASADATFPQRTFGDSVYSRWNASSTGATTPVSKPGKVPPVGTGRADRGHGPPGTGCHHRSPIVHKGTTPVSTPAANGGDTSLAARPRNTIDAV